VNRSTIAKAAAPDGRQRVAYLVSRFPKLTETFVLYEMLELQRNGIAVDVYPLIRSREPCRHAAADAFLDGAFCPPTLAAQSAVDTLYWLRRAPRRLLRMWCDVLAGNAWHPKFLSRALAILPRASRISRRMLAVGTAHVHAHWATHPALAAYCVHRLTGIPYSFTIHAHDLFVARPMLPAKIHRAAFVVTISDYNRRFIEQCYGPATAGCVRVLHCGVDTARFRPAGAGARAQPPRVLCVAGLEEKKGHRYLLDACARLQRAGVPFVCDCAGGGKLLGRLRGQAADRGLADRVRFLGPQPQERMIELLRRADLVVQPSIRLRTGKMEGIPVALMEAMAMALPVVATDLSGVPELVEHGVNGLLAPPGDAAALATAMRRILEDPERGAAFGRAGRHKVMRDFDLRKNAARLRSLITGDGLPGGACT